MSTSVVSRLGNRRRHHLSQPLFPAEYTRQTDTIVATDASVRRSFDGHIYHSWAFTTTTGMSASGNLTTTEHEDCCNRQCCNLHELRAIGEALAAVSPDASVRIVSDSLTVVAFVERWRGASPDFTPMALNTTPYTRWVVRSVRSRVLEQKRLRVQHISAHTGHRLNEKADSLATASRLLAEAVYKARLEAIALVEAGLDTSAAVEELRTRPHLSLADAS